jgi:hypothetical protein
MILGMGRHAKTRGQTRQELIDRSTRLENGCWEWQGPRWGGSDKRLYGAINYLGKTRSAHIVSYMIFKGEVPEGMDIEHTCQFPRCVNPEHLQPATRLQNIRRAHPWLNEGKYKCGHPIGKTYGKCLICWRERHPMADQSWAKGFCVNGHDLSKVKIYKYGKQRRCSICHGDYVRFLRHQNIIKGLCSTLCCKERAIEGQRLCQRHKDLQATNSHNYWLRKLAKK